MSLMEEDSVTGFLMYNLTQLSNFIAKNNGCLILCRIFGAVK